MPTGVAAHVNIETMLFGIISVVARLQSRGQVPFADARRRVAGGLQLFGQSDFFKR